jgi:hypothetical protein
MSPREVVSALGDAKCFGVRFFQQQRFSDAPGKWNQADYPTYLST